MAEVEHVARRATSSLDRLEHALLDHGGRLDGRPARGRISAWVEVDRWHGWDTTQNG